METKFTPVCICTRLRLAARESAKLYDAALGQTGLNIAQYALMRAIERLGEPTINGLSAETQLDPSTLGRNIRVLERAGLLYFAPGEDRRTRVIGITEEGWTTLARARSNWETVQRDLERRLGPGGREALFAMLEALERTPENGPASVIMPSRRRKP